jgi:hypothetical protein
VKTESSILRFIDAVERAGVPYMVTGALASSTHGKPRATYDLDLVVAPAAGQLEKLVDELTATNCEVDRDEAFIALALRGTFQAVDVATTWKADFIIRKDRAFSEAELERRVAVVLGERRIDFATAEDVLIANLEWAKTHGSERQVDDAAGIIRIQGDDLDAAYVARWVEELYLGDHWADAKSRA